MPGYLSCLNKLYMVLGSNYVIYNTLNLLPSIDCCGEVRPSHEEYQGLGHDRLLDYKNKNK